jgi:O-succinylbenzoic acid--CoA ligase
MEIYDCNMTFKGNYTSGFKDHEFVEETISHWSLNGKVYTLKTSGSTGMPREVQLDRKLLVWSAEQTKERLKLGSEKLFCCLPIRKTGGFMQLIRSLHFGWEIKFVNPHLNPFKDTDPDDATLISLTPSQLQNILAECPEKLSGFRNILVGGAHIYDDLLLEIEEYNTKHPSITFWETYGMTETASNIALKNLTLKEKYFTPNKGVEINSVQGHLSINILPFNLNFETTDLAVVSKGKFKVLGRIDDVINSGGVKIHPAVIEPKIKDILKGLRIDRKLYLASEKDRELGEKAVLVLEGAPITDSNFVLEILKRELPDYQAPKDIAFVDEIEETDTGKIIRRSID